jgi:AcrR family transcriptional regulator
MARTVDNEKRRSLASEAINILQREGLELSMSSLATMLGIKRPTLLYYFPNRAAIVQVALEDLLAKQIAYVVSEMMACDHPVDRLYAHVRAVHQYHEGKEDRLIFMIQALATASKEHTNAILEIGNRAFEAHRQALVSEIAGAIEEGRVHPCNPTALVQLTRGIVDGMLVQRVMTQCQFEPIHQFLWEHVLKPLKRDPEIL